MALLILLPYIVKLNALFTQDILSFNVEDTTKDQQAIFNMLAYPARPTGFLMFKQILNGLIENPIATSVFVIDFILLLFIRPPFLFSLLLLATLAGSCMYLGQKLAVFK